MKRDRLVLASVLVAIAIQLSFSVAVGAGVKSTPDPARPETPAASIPRASDPPVDFLLITAEPLIPAFQPLLDWKTAHGVAVAVRTVDWIYANYTNGDEPARVREFLKDAYQQWNLKSVLLGGDAEIVPVRFAKSWAWNPIHGGLDIACDLYYACLDGTWDANGNGVYGEGIRYGYNDEYDEVDLAPELRLGRVPASSTSEVVNWVSKYLDYVDHPPLDGSLRRAVVLGEVLFDSGWEYGDCDTCPGCPPQGRCVTSDGATDCFEFLQHLAEAPRGSFFTPVELYERDYWWKERGHPNALRLDFPNLARETTMGAGILFSMTHGDTSRWAIGPDRLRRADLIQPTRSQLAPRAAGLVFASETYSAAIDGECMAEGWMLSPRGGAVSMIAPSNVVFPITFRVLTQDFLAGWPGDGSVTPWDGLRLVDEYWNVQLGTLDTTMRAMLYGTIFFGDPDMPVWTEDPVASDGGSSPAAAAPDATRGHAVALELVDLGSSSTTSGTTFRLLLPRSDQVVVRLVDLSGRVVRVLWDGPLPSGVQSLSWDERDARGRDLPSGVYFARAEGKTTGIASARHVVVR